jgi:hypothetical protein
LTIFVALRPLSSNSVETQIRFDVFGSQAIDLFKSPDNEIGIMQIQFDAVATPAGLFGGE